MHRLSLLTILVLQYAFMWAQTPHGESFAVDCRACHNTGGWEIDIDTFHFNHDTMAFALQGAHTGVDCRDCHTTLIFSEAPMDCASCHQDVHSQSVGNDCIRCHTPESWLVDNIPELHEENGFPLMGVHSTLACVDCHLSETQLRFDRIGNDCINCHREDYEMTENPDHKAAGFSLNCAECHGVTSPGWKADKIDHNFFPLEGGHDLPDCNACHNGPDYSGLSPECISCHQEDYDGTSTPDHQAGGFGTDCKMCHTLDPGWMPARFRDHDDLYFPIYSGEHEGEWDACIDCHTDPNDYSTFRCTNCHTNPGTDNDHRGVNGYVYDDQACFACHPRGSEDDNFDHNRTNFPLTGAHIGVNCLECHENGFAGTSTACASCHTEDFNETTNPDHSRLNFPTDCAQCHTTEPGWRPASFDIHDDYYELRGAHAAIANECLECHNGDYNNTPNTCAGCHLEDYEGTVDPDHQANQFSQECTDCHTENAWVPSTFDHDGQYFPIYSGEHEGEWDACVDCHTTPGDFTQFSCVVCHMNPQTDDEHMGVPGYVYADPFCLACHPTGDADNVFDHNSTDFPLTGAHIDAGCLECHAAGFEGTSTACVDCHQDDFNGTTNPDHQSLNFGTDCAMCHTTEPGWMPARFDNHNDYYPLNGAHASIANQCAECHNGDYNNTPNTCVGCHQSDYDGANNPDHSGNQFPTECRDCHTEDAWVPSTFDHDGQYFPIYSGKHEGEWMDCVDCHTTPGDFTRFSCVVCHLNPQTDEDHMGVNGYIYSDPACLACHPTGDADETFNHDATNFPLTGGHLGVNCLECHENGFEGTSTNCVDCHQDDFNGTVNPDHQNLNFGTDCAQCHTTQPGWMPAQLPNHDDFYELRGAHAAIAMECATCHNGDYNNTPNTCVGCHQDDYNGTMNPDHESAQFSTDCILCHNEDAWVPANFDHDGQYFPIYSGTHDGVWTECIDCHMNLNNYAEVSCTNCHINPETDDAHMGVNGYVYSDPACLACHPNGEADMAFSHDNTGFPLTGAHDGADCLECHQNGYQGTPTDCFACHETDFNASANPNHVNLNIPTSCADCHTTEPGWTPATFAIHDQYYALTGAHAAIADQCADCHNGDYNNTPNTCVGCHQNDYNTTVNPDHENLAIPTTCDDCHTTDPGWTPATFGIHDQYYALTGAHAAIANQCADCHNGDYNNTPNTCVGCHQDDYNGTTDPDHEALAFPTTCDDCHTTDPGWTPATFAIHDQYYPLTGAHAAIASQCADCHNGNYNNTPNTCVGCHQDDYNASTNPDHETLALPTTCDDCHTTEPGWAPASFDIHDDYYELRGAHLAIANQCADCHNGDYNNTPNTCVGCHQDDYNGTTDPDHQQNNLATDCTQCHSEDAWSPSTFDHSQYYTFNGAHVAIANQCFDCHMGEYMNTPNTCFGCHEDDYNGTTNPDHQQNNLNTDCTQCHNENSWTPSTFDHSQYYTFNGAHIAIANQCFECHMGMYNNTPNTCFGCHQDDYNATTNPDHQQNNLNTDCTQCHNEDAWTPSSFDHNQYYVFNGAHIAIANQCFDCHMGEYNNTPNTCFGCHDDDYNATTNPDHQQNNLNTDCTQCHNEDAWVPSNFDHDQYYPLNGAHQAIALDCYACHQGIYNNTPNTCYGCHQDDYNTANDPNHVTSQFPTDCTVCHGENAWVPANFDHDGMYFPIYSGKHEGEWNQCIDCHTTPGVFTEFSCIDCHEHSNQNEVNQDHQGVAGYQYNSQACYNCHPTGED